MQRLAQVLIPSSATSGNDCSGIHSEPVQSTNPFSDSVRLCQADFFWNGKCMHQPERSPSNSYFCSFMAKAMIDGADVICLR